MPIKCRPRFFFAALIATLLLISGCNSDSGYVDSSQLTIDSWIEMREGLAIGQSFVSQQAGLSTVQISVSGVSRAENVSLQILSGIDASMPIRSATIHVEPVSAHQQLNFRFEPIANSARTPYLLRMWFEPNSSLSVGAADQSTYLSGIAYVGESPINKQLSFRLTYGVLPMLVQLVGESARWIGLFLIALLMILIPGTAIWLWLKPDSMDISAMEVMCITYGLGAAVIPIATVWVGLFGLKINLIVILGLFGFCLVAIGFMLINNKSLWRGSQEKLFTYWHQVKTGRLALPPITSTAWGYATLAVVCLLIVIGRFYAIRSLEYPMWGDSVHHTIISELLLENGGLFQSWQPFAPMVSFTYHFGFHVLASIFGQLAGLEANQAVLIYGQVVNCVAVFVLFPLGKRISGSIWGGILTVMIAGIAIPMPFMYVNWGRYTQLAGQVLLPIVFLMTSTLLTRKPSFGLGLMVTVLVAGLALTHYRIALICLVWLACLLVVTIISRKNLLRAHIIQFIWMGAMAIILLIPWALQTLEGNLPTFVGTSLAPANVQSTAGEVFNDLPDLLSLMPMTLWILFGVSAIFLCIRRNWLTIAVITACVASLILTNPGWLGLPGNGLITNFALSIASYIPAAITIGGASGYVLDWSLRRLARWPIQSTTYQKIALTSLAIVLISTGAFFTNRELGLVNPMSAVMVTEPDIRMFEWIEANTTRDSVFAVNSFLAYDNKLVVGSDAGWWLPFATRRKSILPPILYSAEKGPYPQYAGDVLQFHKELLATNEQTLASLLMRAKIDYIFIGQRDGRVNTQSPSLSRLDLANAKSIRLVHQIDGARLYKVDGPPP